MSPSTSRALARREALLWAGFAAWPLVVRLLARGAALLGPDASLARAALVAALTLAATVSGPIAAALSLRRLDASAPRSRHPGLVLAAFALTAAPALYALLSTVTFLDWVTGALPFLWIAVAALGAVAPHLRASPAPFVDERRAPASWRWRALHGGAAVLVATFAAAHVLNHLASLHSLAAHARVMAALRVVYRHPVAEVLLVAAVVVQLVSGVRLAWRARLTPATAVRDVQLLSGATLAAFLVSHATAVFVLARGVLHVDPSFSWAMGGPRGLLAPGALVHLLPYYGLGVLALFAHIASEWVTNLAHVVGRRWAGRIAASLFAAGVTVALALMGSLSFPRG